MPAPANLTAQIHPLSVTLTWTIPIGAKIQLFQIYRGSDPLGDVVPPTTTYTDATVSPGRSYTFEVSALSNGVQSPSASTTVVTPKLPLSAARVSGRFLVHVTVVSQSGFAKYDKRYSIAWRFTPRRSAGACTLAWKDLDDKGMAGTLHLKNGAHSGSGTGPFNTKCGSHLDTDTLTVHFHVSRAHASDGEWVASKVVGTFQLYAPAAFGCVTATATESFTANSV